MKKGFSLLETLVVITIIVILLFILGPLFLPEKIKYDQYANGFVNMLYRAKMAAIFNLYNTNVIYNPTTGIFTIFTDENRNNVRDNNEQIIHRFPQGLDFLRRTNTRFDRLSVFNGTLWVNLLIMTNQEVNIVIFNRLGFAETTIANTQLIDIYITNPQIQNRYRYEYAIRITSGGDIRLTRRRL